MIVTMRDAKQASNELSIRDEKKYVIDPTASIKAVRTKVPPRINLNKLKKQILEVFSHS